MARYILLMSWTEAGIRDVKGAGVRLQQGQKLFERYGGRVEATYFTMGPHDTIVVAEFPDDESANRAILEAASAGNFRSVTLKAWTPTEFQAMVDGIPMKRAGALGERV